MQQQHQEQFVNNNNNKRDENDKNSDTNRCETIYRNKKKLSVTSLYDVMHC